MLSKISVAALAVASLVQLVSASGAAIIKNQCDEDVYMWVVSNTAGAMQTIPAGQSATSPYQTNSDGGGISVKLATQPNLDGPITQYEYTLTNMFWYDVSNINGSPFTNKGLTLIPSDSSCRSIICDAGVELCSAVYNQPDDNSATAACGLGVDTTLVLCSGQTGNNAVASASDIAKAPVKSAAPEVGSNPILAAVHNPEPAKAEVTAAPAITAAPAVNNGIRTTFVTHIVTVTARDAMPEVKRDQLPKRAAHRHHFHRHAGDSN